MAVIVAVPIAFILGGGDAGTASMIWFAIVGALMYKEWQDDS